MLKGPKDCTIIDAGINVNGSRSGLIISKICLGGLGDVNINPNNKTA